MNQLPICPVCEEHTERKYLPHWEAVGCSACGLLYKPDMSTTEELYNYYRYEYLDHRTPGPDRIQNRAIRLASIIGQFFIKSPERHLDIGSAQGELLEAVHCIWGTERVGVELCKRSVANYDPEIKVYETVDKVKGKFDLITMSHVLEHLPEPMKMLRDIHKVLRKRDGHLIIEVPNVCGEPTALPPTKMSSHVLGFSQPSLHTALVYAGFYVREIQTALPLGFIWGKRPPAYLTAVATIKPMGEIKNVAERNYVQLDDVLMKMGVVPMQAANYIKMNENNQPMSPEAQSTLDKWLAKV